MSLTDDECAAIRERILLYMRDKPQRGTHPIDDALIRAGHAAASAALAAPEPMNAAGAVYCLLGDLTSRKNVPPLGSSEDAAPWAEIANDFCNKWKLFGPRFPGHTDSYDAYAQRFLNMHQGKSLLAQITVFAEKLATERTTAITAERDRLRERLDNLLYEVARKYPGETRYETAKRYIRERELPSGQAGTQQAKSSYRGGPQC